MTPTEIRLALLQNGYDPIPLRGKRPDMMKGWQWQAIGHATPEQVAMWAKSFPDAVNTGVLAKLTCGLDLDVLNDKAVDAMVDHVRERYEEAGYVLPRIGKWPKCLIPFRTDEPFKKITLGLGRDEEKIEFLADGQQFVSFGLHPDTHADYDWPRGSPLEVEREKLPYIRQAEAEALVAELGEIAVAHGYGPKPSAGGNGADPEPADIEDLTRAILSGESLHNSVLKIAGSYAARDIHKQACIDYIGLAFTAAHQPRYGGRWDECMKAVSYCYAKEDEKNKQQAPQPSVTSLASLKDHVFMPLNWIVPNYIPEGVTLLCGKPKIGKSWLALAIAIATGRGDDVLGETCPKRAVLYCALEDTERRMQSRTEKILGRSEPWPDNVHYLLDLLPIDKGGIAQLEQSIADKSLGLIIIDTLAKFRGARLKNEEQYQCDYRTMTALLDVSRKTGVAIVVIHHVRKAAAEDVFDMISGTMGLSGASDTLIMLTYANVDTQELRLTLRGRDVDHDDKTIDFDADMGTWEVTGSYEGKETNTADTRSLILAVLQADKRPIKPAQIAELTKLPRATVKMALGRMLKAGQVLRSSYGAYTV